jgi:homoserine dehydrogenase
MRQLNVALLGLGNVGRALVRLLQAKSAELQRSYGLGYRITGVASRRLGWLVQPAGFDIAELLNADAVGPDSDRVQDIHQWLDRVRPDAVFETTSLNPESGQPAIDYLRAVLSRGAHAISANKGTVVYGYEALTESARSAGKRFLFEATFLDSAPVFSLFRETLPGARLRSFSGIFNSTTNVIIETMEAGRGFAEGVRAAQELGITETDPSHDIDGWDATVKVCAATRVLLGVPLLPAQVSRQGIRDLQPQRLQTARAEGKPIRLVARARLEGDDLVVATVRPEVLSATDPLAGVRGTSLAVHFELDVMPGLTIISHRPNLMSTAYGLLADFLNALR